MNNKLTSVYHWLQDNPAVTFTFGLGTALLAFYAYSNFVAQPADANQAEVQPLASTAGESISASQQPLGSMSTPADAAQRIDPPRRSYSRKSKYAFPEHLAPEHLEPATVWAFGQRTPESAVAFGMFWYKCTGGGANLSNWMRFTSACEQLTPAPPETDWKPVQDKYLSMFDFLEVTDDHLLPLNDDTRFSLESVFRLWGIHPVTQGTGRQMRYHRTQQEPDAAP